MAGNTENEGGLEVADAIVGSVNDRKPAFLMLNEVCENQLVHIDKALSDYSSYFKEVLAGEGGGPATCGNEALYGNAVLYRNDTTIHDEDFYDLSTPDNLEQRRMVCVFAATPKVVACATHLTNDDGSVPRIVRQVQAAEVAEISRGWGSGYARIIGGDFNDTPRSDTMDNLYHRDYGDGARGEFKEVDSPCGNTIQPTRLAEPFTTCRDGEETHYGESFFGMASTDRKIDYVFVSPAVRVHWADATFSDYSDHDPLWAGVSF